MERRTFLRTLVGGVAATAAVRTWPFRTYSFPAGIIIPVLDVTRPAVLIKQGGFFPSWSCSDGSDLGRGTGTAYRRVNPEDDLKKLFAEGWRDPRVEIPPLRYVDSAFCPDQSIYGPSKLS